MFLIPMPKKIETQKEKVAYKGICPYKEDIGERLIKAISKLPTDDKGAKLTVNIKGETGEAYILDLYKDEVIITAESEKGAFYAIQTLRQIFKNSDITVMHIEDKPDFSYRGVYHDITRGKVPTVATLKELIDNLAYFKINSLQLYTEYTFSFKEFCDSIEKTGYLNAEEIKELDDYCYENFIEFIPSIATFGHIYDLMEKEKYKHLCAIKDYKQQTHIWQERLCHHTINPKYSESYELITSLIDQYVPLFRSDKFNICCDETEDLKHCCEDGEDVGELYISFVNKLIDYVKTKGKKPMMWADILLKHPGVIDNLPEDVILLNWNYNANVNEDTIIKIKESKREQIVCPGTSTWYKFCERLQTEEPNISLMTEYGYKHGAKGVLNTNWGDWGNPCSLELAMYGLVLGAEKSWTVATKTGEEFDKAVSHLLYENENGMKYLRELNELHRNASWIDFAKYYSNSFYPEQLSVNFSDTKEENFEKVQERFKGFIDALSKEKWKKDEYRQEMIVTAEGLLVMAELILKAQKCSVTRITDTESWLKKYRQKWTEKNKESELNEIEKVFRFYESL